MPIRGSLQLRGFLRCPLIEVLEKHIHFQYVLDNYSVWAFISSVDLIKDLTDKPFAVVVDHFLARCKNWLALLNGVEKKLFFHFSHCYTTLYENLIGQAVIL